MTSWADEQIRDDEVRIPRDLALPGRILRSVLSALDRINPILSVSQPKELELDAIGRMGQARGLIEMRDAAETPMNAQRLAEWSARYRPHTFHVPLQLPQWDRNAPAPPAGDRFAMVDLVQTHQAPIRYFSITARARRP